MTRCSCTARGGWSRKERDAGSDSIGRASANERGSSGPKLARSSETSSDGGRCEYNIASLHVFKWNACQGSILTGRTRVEKTSERRLLALPPPCAAFEIGAQVERPLSGMPAEVQGAIHRQFKAL